ncbi:IS91 family transposase, partial [Candidatus Erwinia dacicola]|nr:IS91 family transposase [Candidatus Erwinia dacicola]
MYIPRPAKLLFTVDDGWNRYLEKHGDSVSQWTPLAVERMHAGGMKSTEQWIAEQQHVLPDCEGQHIIFTMP